MHHIAGNRVGKRGEKRLQRLCRRTGTSFVIAAYVAHIPVRVVYRGDIERRIKRLRVRHVQRICRAGHLLRHAVHRKTYERTRHRRGECHRRLTDGKDVRARRAYAVTRRHHGRREGLDGATERLAVDHAE